MAVHRPSCALRFRAALLLSCSQSEFSCCLQLSCALRLRTALLLQKLFKSVVHSNTFYHHSQYSSLCFIFQALKCMFEASEFMFEAFEYKFEGFEHKSKRIVRRMSTFKIKQSATLAVGAADCVCVQVRLSPQSATIRPKDLLQYTSAL